jgi:hypothetical protein
MSRLQQPATIAPSSTITASHHAAQCAELEDFRDASSTALEAANDDIDGLKAKVRRPCACCVAPHTHTTGPVWYVDAFRMGLARVLLIPHAAAARAARAATVAAAAVATCYWLLPGVGGTRLVGWVHSPQLRTQP